ncbi:MAG: methyltransferase domain-containing protein [Prolixibacteraceae bacterium]
MNQQFYASIAQHYQHIFPFNPDQVEFLRQVLPYNGAKILDVGSATGDLSFALTHFGFPVWSFDFDAQMVELAKKTKQEDTLFPAFEQLDMRNIAERYPESYFNTVICFGNTLVHLLSDDDIRKFIQASFKVLSPEGKLTIQILNYNHIIDHQIESLPLIENEHIRFERRYDFQEGTDLIDFNTKLTIKSNGQEISNSVKLYALRKNKLQELLEEAGFTGFEFHGNFKRDPLQETSIPLIVTCQKPV